MKYDAVIFDLDGTLWNATKTTTRGWNNALKSLNIDRTISISEIESVTGKPTDECIKILFSKEHKNYNNLLDIINNFEKEAILIEGGKFYDNCVDIIKQLQKSYKLFIVSNCQKWYLDAFMDHSGCTDYFFGYDCHGMSNTTKAIMLSNLKEKFNLRNPVYIGDTEGDKLAADEANYDFIFASYGFGVLTDSIKRISTLSDLKKLF